MTKDLHEELLKGYEFVLGRIKNREEFKAALQQTLTSEDVRVVLLTPYIGEMSIAKLERKAARIGIPAERLHEIIRRLVPEGFITSYIKLPDKHEGSGAYRQAEPLADMRHPNRVVTRGDIIVMAEMQVRKLQDDPMRNAAAHYMQTLIEDGGQSFLTKTPTFRVLPVERTLTGGTEARKIPVGVTIPNSREVLPIDVVSELIREEPLIVVAECFCRSTKRIVDKPCHHPLETCFYFGVFGLAQLEAGRARRVEYAEALRILYECEEVGGMIHNVSNARSELGALCNCCACACVAMQGLFYGRTNTIAPSRFVVSHDGNSCTHCKACVKACPLGISVFAEDETRMGLDRCIGCGLCVSRCPEKNLHMVLRKAPPKIYQTADAVDRQIMREASISLVKRKLLGR